LNKGASISERNRKQLQLKMKIVVLFFSSSLAFFFGKNADQIDGFCYQRCQRVAKIWTVIHLRLHLSKKLRIHPSEIAIPGSAGIIDVGSCVGTCKNGGDCHAERKTAIVFEINGREFQDGEYYIIDSCSCTSEIHYPGACVSPF
jgi:hypothetical protein